MVQDRTHGSGWSCHHISAGSRGKGGKSRIHLDLWVDELGAAVALVRELGGTFTDEIHLYDEGTVYVMSDVEGNECCLVGPPNRPA